MINLCLVVIATQFSETKKRETERMQQERRRQHSSNSSSICPSEQEPASCYIEILRYIAHVVRKAHRKIGNLVKRSFIAERFRRRGKAGDNIEASASVRRRGRKARGSGDGSGDGSGKRRRRRKPKTETMSE